MKDLSSNILLLGSVTGGPSSSCEMITLRNKSHKGIFTAALRNKKLSQILNTNTSPYFQSALLAIWPLTMLKRSHFSELSISRFTHKRSTRLHTPLPNARSEKRKSNLKITRRPQEVSFHFEIFHYLPSFFLLRPLLILDEFEHELSKPKQKAEVNNTDTRFDNS